MIVNMHKTFQNICDMPDLRHVGPTEFATNCSGLVNTALLFFRESAFYNVFYERV